MAHKKERTKNKHETNQNNQTSTSLAREAWNKRILNEGAWGLFWNAIYKRTPEVINALFSDEMRDLYEAQELNWEEYLQLEEKIALWAKQHNLDFPMIKTMAYFQLRIWYERRDDPYPLEYSFFETFEIVPDELKVFTFTHHVSFIKLDPKKLKMEITKVFKARLKNYITEISRNSSDDPRQLIPKTTKTRLLKNLEMLAYRIQGLSPPKIAKRMHKTRTTVIDDLKSACDALGIAYSTLPKLKPGRPKKTVGNG